jgi:hypothetical protein
MEPSLGIILTCNFSIRHTRDHIPGDRDGGGAPPPER